MLCFMFLLLFLACQRILLFSINNFKVSLIKNVYDKKIYVNERKSAYEI